MGFIHDIEEMIWGFTDTVYTSLSWFGVVLMMAIESCMIPLPSEVIMPLAGQYLVKSGDNWVGILEAGFFGALGCTIGSIAAYWLGAMGGRPLIERYGKYVLINIHHLHTAEKWFDKYGEATAFFSRLIPVVRTFISFPAGVARMNFPKFVLFTFLGSFPWSAGLAWAGAVWQPRAIREALRPFDIPIVIVILLLVGWFVYRSLRSRRQPPDAESAVGAGETYGERG